MIEESNGNKCLVLTSTDKYREVSTKYRKLLDWFKYMVKTINGGEVGECRKDFMKIKFGSDNNLPLY